MNQETINVINEMTGQNFVDLDDLINSINKMSDQILNLQRQVESGSKEGRKAQVLELLKQNESISILDISKQLGISTKNVSSQLTYLRSDGYKIFTDDKGRKILVNKDK